MKLNKLAKKIHRNNVKKGFYEGGEKNTGEVIALIHSELSEALEADRKGRHCEEIPIFIKNIDGPDQFKGQFEDSIKDTFEDEMADALIRILDYCGYKGIDIDSHVELKIKYNKMRPKKHGKNY